MAAAIHTEGLTKRYGETLALDSLDLPGWTIDLTPFHQVALVPAKSFKAGAAIAMLVVAALAMLASVRLFERRDLTGS
ncbi:MAG TPA: hypothetical protein VLB79_03335 [Solirubrobacterales bacterium]|nr:hypothetical protein [Solirubrobacterales bacterium]